MGYLNSLSLKEFIAFSLGFFVVMHTDNGFLLLSSVLLTGDPLLVSNRMAKGVVLDENLFKQVVW